MNEEENGNGFPTKPARGPIERSIAERERFSQWIWRREIAVLDDDLRSRAEEMGWRSPGAASLVRVQIVRELRRLGERLA